MSIRLGAFHLVLMGAFAVGLGVGVVLEPGTRGQAARASVPSEPRRAPPPPVAAAAPTRHVLIVSEDGMRPDLLGGASMYWHGRLMKEGAFSGTAQTIRSSDTLPSHAAMLSGVDVDRHGLSWNSWRPEKGFILVPTIFTRASEHGLKTAAFVGKQKLRHILPEGTIGTFARPGYACKKVSEEAARYLEQERPALAFVHFSDPDGAGHSRGWLSEAYQQAVADADRCLGTLYLALERAGTLDDTLIIVTADHGGHDRGHNADQPSDRDIPWIARGPRVRTGYAIKGPISTMDTAPTVLGALGLPQLDRLVGRPVTEIYQ